MTLLGRSKTVLRVILVDTYLQGLPYGRSGTRGSLLTQGPTCDLILSWTKFLVSGVGRNLGADPLCCGAPWVVGVAGVFKLLGGG